MDKEKIIVTTKTGFDIVETISLSKKELKDDYEQLLLEEKQAHNTIAQATKVLKDNPGWELTPEEKELEKMLKRIGNAHTVVKHQENLATAKAKLESVEKSKLIMYRAMPELKRMKK